MIIKIFYSFIFFSFSLSIANADQVSVATRPASPEQSVESLFAVGRITLQMRGIDGQTPGGPEFLARINEGLAAPRSNDRPEVIRREVDSDGRSVREILRVRPPDLRGCPLENTSDPKCCSISARINDDIGSRVPQRFTGFDAAVWNLTPVRETTPIPTGLIINGDPASCSIYQQRIFRLTRADKDRDHSNIEVSCIVQRKMPEEDLKESYRRVLETQARLQGADRGIHTTSLLRREAVERLISSAIERDMSHLLLMTARRRLEFLCSERIAFSNIHIAEQVNVSRLQRAMSEIPNSTLLLPGVPTEIQRRGDRPQPGQQRPVRGTASEKPADKQK